MLCNRYFTAKIKISYQKRTLNTKKNVFEVGRNEYMKHIRCGHYLIVYAYKEIVIGFEQCDQVVLLALEQIQY
jgi:hypothetical protein